MRLSGYYYEITINKKSFKGKIRTTYVKNENNIWIILKMKKKKKI